MRTAPASPPLDTLAQGVQSEPDRKTGGGALRGAPSGPAAVSSPTLTFRKRARAKALSLPVAVTLAELRSPLERSYRNTAYCGQTLKQHNGKVTQRWCGNRWCLLCARVKAARSLARYGPVIAGWGDAHMVTLTIPNVPGAELTSALDAIRADLLDCRRAMRRTHGVRLVGVWKRECTHNVRRDDYHPHAHIITETREQAELLLGEWMKRHPEASAKAQDVRACNGDVLREVFKYLTKLVAPVRGKDGGRMIPAHALDTIFQALKGKRTYSPLGFKLPKASDEERSIDEGPGTPSPVERPAGTLTVWEWSQWLRDWVDYGTGELLSGYEPGEAFARFVDSIAPPEACDLGDDSG